MALEKDIAPRTIKQDLGLSNDKQDNALPLHKKKIEKKNQDACCRCTVKSVTKKILFTDETTFTAEETLNNKKDWVYARSFKDA